jgi:Rieske Fe-S protein
MASSDDPKQLPRRDLLNVAVGGTATAFGLAVVYPVARFVDPPSRPRVGPVSVGKVEDFPTDGAKLVTVNERPVLVFRARGGQMRAFSALCTHLQCVVAYSAERKQIECPCHRGAYSLDGQNIAGPPPRPLDELLVTVNEGNVIVSVPA